MWESDKNKKITSCKTAKRSALSQHEGRDTVTYSCSNRDFFLSSQICILTLSAKKKIREKF